MYELEGKHAKAIVYARDVEEECDAQIKEILDNEFLASEKIRIMSDCHAGNGICIGFTSTITGDWAVPNYIGVDIGCGVSSHMFGMGEMDDGDFRKFDGQVRRSIPSGYEVNKKFDEGRCREAWDAIEIGSLHRFLEEIKDLEKRLNLSFRHEHYVEQSIGTLGGGNHFIAINKGSKGDLWITIHSGSRNFGLKIANHFQKKANDKGYLEGEDKEDYIYAMGLAQRYARLNRAKMIWELLKQYKMGLSEGSYIESVHNYIDLDNGIIRKGAISAQEGETCIIPINMADGVLLCKGKGNPEWNWSAPHGAGRVLSRNKSRKTFSMEEYRERMGNVWSSCVNEATLDESPMAYKKMGYLMEQIGDTVEIVDHWKEIYNFKAAE